MQTAAAAEEEEEAKCTTIETMARTKVVS